MIREIALTLSLVGGQIPYFKLPFACGQSWAATTYAGHWPNTNSLDFFHKGGPTLGQPVLAPATGTLEYTGWWSERSGWTIILDHGGGWKTYFLHLREKSFVPQGDQVMQGQHIGYVGNSGSDGGHAYVPHLHYTVMLDEEAVQAVFSAEPTYPPASMASRNCGSSLDGDAKADVVVLYEPEINPSRVRFADLDGDGRKEMVVLDWDGSAVVRQSGVRLPARIADPDRVLFADLDGDRRDEMVTVEFDGELWAFRPDGSRWVVGGGWFNPARVRFTDLDGDGRDEVVSLDAEGTVRSWRNVGGGYAGTATIIASGQIPPEQVRFADTDGNGRDELVIFRLDGSVETYWNTGQGVFEHTPEVFLTDVDPSVTFLV